MTLGYRMQVPYWQSRIVQGCRKRGKPVIVATNMLESMIGNPTPTRAEASTRHCLCPLHGAQYAQQGIQSVGDAVQSIRGQCASADGSHLRL